jgi:hypothetical protein
MIYYLRGKIDIPNTQIHDWFETATRDKIDTPNTQIHDWFERATIYLMNFETVPAV